MSLLSREITFCKLVQSNITVVSLQFSHLKQATQMQHHKVKPTAKKSTSVLNVLY